MLLLFQRFAYILFLFFFLDIFFTFFASFDSRARHMKISPPWVLYSSCIRCLGNAYYCHHLCLFFIIFLKSFLISSSSHFILIFNFSIFFFYFSWPFKRFVIKCDIQTSCLIFFSFSWPFVVRSLLRLIDVAYRKEKKKRMPRSFGRVNGCT